MKKMGKKTVLNKKINKNKKGGLFEKHMNKNALKWKPGVTTWRKVLNPSA